MVDTNDDTISIFMGNGDGSFAARTTLANVSASRRLSLGDFDEDGEMDILTTSNGGGGTGLALFSGNGDGTFEAEQFYGGTGSTGIVELADLDGDGNLDAVGDGATGIINIWMGVGDGSFEAVITISAF